MTRVWWLATAAIGAIAIIPLACSEDETTSGAGPTTGSNTTTSSNTSTGTTTSSGGSAGMNAGGMNNGGMNNGGMNAGGGPGGANGQNCEDCADNAENNGCQAEFEACMPGPQTPCETWWDCYTDDCFANDFTAACFAACDATRGGGTPEAMALKACLCGECANACTPVCQ
jgi:hypothetical protein